MYVNKPNLSRHGGSGREKRLARGFHGFSKKEVKLKATREENFRSRPINIFPHTYPILD